MTESGNMLEIYTYSHIETFGGTKEYLRAYLCNNFQKRRGIYSFHEASPNLHVTIVEVQPNPLTNSFLCLCNVNVGLQYVMCRSLNSVLYLVKSVSWLLLQAYVTCTLGVSHIGYVMTAFCLIDAVASLLVGWINKCTGCIRLLCLGLLVHFILIMVMLLWTPIEDIQESWQLYFMAAGWGIGDAIFQTQCACKYIHTNCSALC